MLLDPRLADCRRIFLRDFALQVSIGFHDFELKARQRVLISVDLFVAIAASSSESDQVHEVLDYDFVRRGIIDWADSRHFNLQETLLDGIVQICLSQPAVRAVRASTQKPDVYPDCRTIGVEVFRFRA
ncbi:MAG: dihydroneopterin aldolase [Quisquiliibacterium sp.]